MPGLLGPELLSDSGEQHRSHALKANLSNLIDDGPDQPHTE